MPSDAIPIIAVARTVLDLRAAVGEWRKAGLTVGLVPTMGALHAGHQTLVREARATCDRVVLSIFVNPRQFGPAEDFAAYPRQEAQDVARAAAAGAALVFAPDVAEMYPRGFVTSVSVGGPSQGLESTHRPGHFDGMATVVSKLLLQCGPDRAYFGEKDYQQLQVVRRMVDDLNIPVEIVGVPTVREADGLALSSRNAYLSAEQRAAAPVLARVLRAIAEGVKAGRVLSDEIAQGVVRLRTVGFDAPDYIALCDAVTLAPMERLDRAARLLVAVRLGKTRLIDNIPVVP